ncbi:UNVERIFIED_CONTAM: hypothetical protein LK11_04980 [Mumia flava]
MLVVGSGLAGFHTARALRTAGFGGTLTVLGAEQHPPYDRPPLSKAYLAGVVSAHDLALDDPEDPLDVDWVRGAGAAALDGPTRTVRTRDGRAFTADAVVLATGAEAVRLGPPVPGTHVLRTLDDADALRSDGVGGARVAVVGGGFVALETAAAATALGARSVTVVSPERNPLLGRLGPLVAAALRGLHERHGVRFVDSARATGFLTHDGGRVRAVVLTTGGSVDADLVVTGVGATPATGWLSGSGVTLGPTGAVVCDVTGGTGVPGVWATGDCAAWDTGVDGAHPGGHWQDAVDQAAVVAASVLGRASAALPDPYFWSEQHDVTVQVAGRVPADAYGRVVAGSVAGADLLVTYERGGVETGILGMNRPREVMRWRRSRAPRTRLVASA